MHVNLIKHHRWPRWERWVGSSIGAGPHCPCHAPVSLQVWVLWLWHLTLRAGLGWGWSAQHHGWPEEKGAEKAELGQCHTHLGMSLVAPVPLELYTLWIFEPEAKPKSTFRLRCRVPWVAQMTTPAWSEQGWGMSFATPVFLELQDLFFWSLLVITGWGWGPQPDGLILLYVQMCLIQTWFSLLLYINVPWICCRFITKPWYCHNSFTENRAFPLVLLHSLFTGNFH